MFGLNNNDNQANNGQQPGVPPMPYPNVQGRPIAPTPPSVPLVDIPAMPTMNTPVNASLPPMPGAQPPPIIPLLNGTPHLPPAAPAAMPHMPQPVPAAPSHPPTTIDTSAKDGLINIKQQALQNLTPLVDKLDQSPDERFKTIMMMIQASDNSALIKEAYEIANDITDEKARAQALLDVVNEINYFTHPGGDAQPANDAK